MCFGSALVGDSVQPPPEVGYVEVKRVGARPSEAAAAVLCPTKRKHRFSYLDSAHAGKEPVVALGARKKP